MQHQVSTTSGRAPLSFNELVDRLNDHLDTDADPEYVPKPIPEDVYVHDTCADIEKIRAEAGWEPQIDLEEELERVCRPYQ